MKRAPMIMLQPSWDKLSQQIWDTLVSQMISKYARAQKSHPNLDITKRMKRHRANEIMKSVHGYERHKAANHDGAIVIRSSSDSEEDGKAKVIMTWVVYVCGVVTVQCRFVWV